MTVQAFLFGKAPAHGDFVSRGLASDVEAVWDAWASREVTRAAEDLGAAFSSAHDAVPPIRFVTGPGDLGPEWRAGAVAASIDATGRRFILAAGLDGLSPARASALGVVVAGRTEILLYAILADRVTADDAIEALAGMLADPAELAAADSLGAATEVAGLWWAAEDATDPVALASPPPGLFAALLDRTARALETAE